MRSGPWLLVACLWSCSAELGPVHCLGDDNCPPGGYCSAAGQCAEPAACVGKQTPSCAVLAPAGLSAIGQRAQVSLGWDSVGGATGYAVRRAITAGGPYFDVATTQVVGLLDQGLSPATSYFYVVHAIGPGGPGPDSPEVSALTVPAPPGHLSAAPGPAEISLRWDPVAGVTSYRVARAGSSGGFATLGTTSSTGTTYVDANLAAGSSWSYEVVALNPSGESAPSPIATATVP